MLAETLGLFEILIGIAILLLLAAMVVGLPLIYRKRVAKRAETIAAQPMDTFWNSQRMIGLERSQCVSLMIKPTASILENKVVISTEGREIGTIQQKDAGHINFEIDFLRGDCQLLSKESLEHPGQQGWMLVSGGEEIAFFDTAPDNDEVYFTVESDKYKFSRSGCFATRNGDAVASFFGVGTTALVHFMAIDKSVPDRAKAVMCELIALTRKAKVG